MVEGPGSVEVESGSINVVGGLTGGVKMGSGRFHIRERSVSFEKF